MKNTRCSSRIANGKHNFVFLDDEDYGKHNVFFHLRNVCFNTFQIKNCCNTRYKGYIWVLLFQRHQMIGYSIVSDNAYAPEQSNSIYISKTNRKLSISYIPILRDYRKKKIRNKCLDQHGNSYVHSEDFSLLQFPLYQYILRYGVYGGSKNQRNPIPKHVELQTISTYSNQ